MRVNGRSAGIDQNRSRMHRCDPMASPLRVDANTRFALARPAERGRHGRLAPVLLTRCEARRTTSDRHENDRSAVARIIPLSQQRAPIWGERNHSPRRSRLRMRQRPGHHPPSGSRQPLDRRLGGKRVAETRSEAANLRALAHTDVVPFLRGCTGALTGPAACGGRSRKDDQQRERLRHKPILTGRYEGSVRIGSTISVPGRRQRWA